MCLFADKPLNESYLFCRETAPEAIGVHRETDYYEKVCGGELTNPWNTNEPYSLGHVPGHILYEGTKSKI